MDRRRVRIIGLLTVVLVLGAACGGDDGGGNDGGATSEGGGGTIQVAGQDANDHGTQDVSGMEEFSLEIDDFYFSPTILQGEPGQALSLELENEGGAAHTFTIDDQGVDVQVDPGSKGTAQVTFPDSGELLFYCRFHAGQGMRGGLKVA